MGTCVCRWSDVGARVISSNEIHIGSPEVEDDQM